MGGDGERGAIGVVAELGANKELAVLGCREHDRVPAATGGDGGEEGTGDGDAVVAASTIYRDGGVAAGFARAVIDDGDGVIAEPASGDGGYASVIFLKPALNGKGVIAITTINKGGLDYAFVAIGCGRIPSIPKISFDGVITGIAIETGICNCGSLDFVIASATAEFCNGVNRCIYSVVARSTAEESIATPYSTGAAVVVR